jgi:putative oxidoreductase
MLMQGGTMIGRLLEPRVEGAYALLRVVAGVMFAFHGVQKIFGVLTPHVPAVGSQIWIGGLLELAAGAAIALGALTAWAAFVASGEMAVAYVQFHWKLQLGVAFWPAVNQGEMALLYSVLFLFIACRGSGRASIDSWRTGAQARAGGG